MPSSRPSSPRKLVISAESPLQISSTVFLPLPMSLECVRHQGLHVFTIDSSLGPHVQAPPVNRLLFFVQQVHQNRSVPLLRFTWKGNCAEAAKSLLKLGVWLFEKHKTKNLPRLQSPDNFPKTVCQTSAPPRILTPASTAASPSPSSQRAHWPHTCLGHGEPCPLSSSCLEH